jgi:putative tricarboxylic transport membrane protein
MALFLGAFMMVGVTPGPMLILQHLDLVFLLLLGIAASSVISIGICCAAAGQLCKIVFAPTDFLYPLTLALILSASYATTGQMWDIVVVICAGLLGLFMDRFGYSRPALCLGFVLGKLLEYYFLTAFKIGGPLFFLTPLSLGILAVMVALLLYPYSKNLRQRWRKA